MLMQVQRLVGVDLSASLRFCGFACSWPCERSDFLAVPSGPHPGPQPRMHRNDSTSTSTPRVKPSTFQASSWLSLPTPIRIMFDRFPIVTYSENSLPQRTTESRSRSTLHIFTLHNEQLSPNPACLKWQIYLLISKVPFSTQSSNNHASPTGALPFLLPAAKSKRDPLPQAISSAKIQRWAETQGAREEKIDPTLDAYTSLIDQNIRNAWLYHMYLCPGNFDSVAKRLYVETASSNPLVQKTLAHQLQTAAQDQLLRTWSFIDSDEVYEQADAAFTALSTLLGKEDYFSKVKSPGLFDASLVAYTHLIFNFGDESIRNWPKWNDQRLWTIFSRHETLVMHRERVIAFAGEGDSS